MIVACHQPNFIPWLGYFAKMARADVFVLLDDVQFTQGHNKHNWTSRVRILSPNGPMWLSIPVMRTGSGQQSILDIRSNKADTRWLTKMIRTLSESYGKAPYFKELAPDVLDIITRHDGSICSTNLALIQHMHGLLGLKSRLVRSSQRHVNSVSTNRLVDLVRTENGTAYLSGDGASDYQQEEVFAQAGIALLKTNFVHPFYPQRGSAEFIVGLSVIDALFNIGAAATSSLLHQTEPFQ